MFEKLFRLLQKTNVTVPVVNSKPIEEIDDSKPRIEILADGFEYVHPYTTNGTTYFKNNIVRAAQFYMAAKTLQEKNARRSLFSQVSERERKHMMDALKRKIDRQIAKERE